jgi:hypothetical protein
VISPFEVAREPVRNLLDRLREALADLGVATHGLLQEEKETHALLSKFVQAKSQSESRVSSVEDALESRRRTPAGDSVKGEPLLAAREPVVLCEPWCFGCPKAVAQGCGQPRFNSRPM